MINVISVNGTNYTVGGINFDSPWHICHKQICDSVTMATSTTYKYEVVITDLYDSSFLQTIGNLFFACIVDIYSVSGASKGNRTEIQVAGGKALVGVWEPPYLWFDRQVARTAQKVSRTGSVLVDSQLTHNTKIFFYFKNTGSGSNKVSASLTAIKLLGINKR